MTFASGDALPWLLLVATLILLARLGWERVMHLRALRRIPIRVHVNGTRGKSSVTRLIASGLRAGGKTVLAKTTGTLARVIFPNERELPIYRPLGANVREQVRVVRLAEATKADVLVVECMALQPVLQWLSERAFVRATHGVITNARPDHLDVMGPGAEDVALALAGMVPVGGKLFTCEEEHLAVFRMACKDRESELVAVGRDEVEAIRDEDMVRFPWYEHPDNVALALSICEAVGVDREVALDGMVRGTPDPGALTFHEVDFFGRHIVFVNAFAANDPVSSEQIWKLCRTRYPEHRAVCVVNCRADRVDRSRQLGETVPGWDGAESVVLVGHGTVFFARAAERAGFETSSLVNLEGRDVAMVFEQLVEQCGDRTMLVGLGNIGGLGLDLVRFFRNRASGATSPRALAAPAPETSEDVPRKSSE